MGGWTFPIIFVPYMSDKIMYNIGIEMHGLKFKISKILNFRNSNF